MFISFKRLAYEENLKHLVLPITSSVSIKMTTKLLIKTLGLIYYAP